MFNPRVLLSLAVALYSFSSLQLNADGAFGIEFGQVLPEESTASKGIQGGYSIDALRPYPEFESYIVKFSEPTGVCMILGFGKTYEDDEWGIQVKGSYEKLIAALSKKYGKVRRNEFLRSGALYDEIDEFSRSISKNQRSHQAIWDIGTEEPTGIAEILLSVNADWTDTWLYIHYKSKDFEACEKAINDEAEGSL